MAKKRMGRPTKPPVEGERIALGLRVTADAKRRLEESAQSSGRSLSQEAEFRLETTFERQSVVMSTLELMLGAELAAFVVDHLMSLGRLKKPVVRELVSAMNAAITETLRKHVAQEEKVAPPDPTLTPEQYRKEYRERHGLPPDMPVPKYPKRADPRTVVPRGKKHAG